jgi:hypothetical protein
MSMVSRRIWNSGLRSDGIIAEDNGPIGLGNVCLNLRPDLPLLSFFLDLKIGLSPLQEYNLIRSAINPVQPPFIQKNGIINTVSCNSFIIVSSLPLIYISSFETTFFI